MGYFNDKDKREYATFLYKNGYSASDIKEIMNIPITTRSIQRFLGKIGIIRDQKKAYRLANNKRISSIRSYWKRHKRSKDSYKHKKISPPQANPPV